MTSFYFDSPPHPASPRPSFRAHGWIPTRLIKQLRTAWLVATPLLGLLAVPVMWNGGLGAPTILLPIRELLFATYSAHASELDSWTVGSGDHSFRTEPAASETNFHARLASVGLSLELDSIGALPTTVAKTQGIIRTFTRPLQEGCGQVNDLLEKVLWVRAGHGCCSDHTEVFIALASEIGLNVREISDAIHTTVGVYAPELRQWMFVDPEYGIMARDSAGHYLSTPGLQRYVLSGRTPVYDFFGNAKHVHSVTDQRFLNLYTDPENFRRLTVTLGNNVIEADREYRELSVLPKPVDQFIGHLSGIRPKYHTYIAGASRWQILWRNAAHWTAVGLAILLTLAFIAYPLALVPNLVVSARRNRIAA